MYQIIHQIHSHINIIHSQSRRHMLASFLSGTGSARHTYSSDKQTDPRVWEQRGPVGRRATSTQPRGSIADVSALLYRCTGAQVAGMCFLQITESSKYVVREPDTVPFKPYVSYAIIMLLLDSHA